MSAIVNAADTTLRAYRICVRCNQFRLLDVLCLVESRQMKDNCDAGCSEEVKGRDGGG